MTEIRTAGSKSSRRLLFVLQIVLDNKTDTFLLIPGEFAQVLQKEGFFVGRYRFFQRGRAVGDNMAHQFVHGGFKIVGEPDQSINVWLGAVILIFVDGLLGSSDDIGKLLLAEPFAQAQGFQIPDHATTSRPYSNNLNV